jgi:zinc metalloprotease ZmpB
MTTASLPAGSIPPGGSTVVGPFTWTPQVVGHECMLMIASADGDLPNTDPATLLPCATGPTPHWRLVPFDNNIGQRNVAPVAGGGRGAGLAASFHNRSFVARNPFELKVEITLEAILPKFLKERGWSVRFLNVDRESFTLPPHGEKTVVFTLVPGKDFSAADVPGGKAGRIEIHTRVDDLLIGGMSYQVDAKLAAPPPEERSTKKIPS